MTRRDVHVLPSLALASAFLAIAGCRGDSRPRPRVVSARLETVSSCADAVAQLRARAIADMERRLDRLLETSGACVILDGGTPASGVPGTSSPTAPGPQAFSGTNVQVAGVDEPDLVKTDGTFLYTVADGRFQILQVWPAAEAHRVAARAVAGRATRLLLSGDRAIVFSALDQGAGGGGVAPTSPVVWGWDGGSCTYGYDCVPQGDGAPLAVTVLDVSDRAAPRVVRELRFDSGSYLAARRIGDAVHAAVVYPARPVPGVDDGHDLLCADPAVLEARVAELRARNRAVISAADLSAFLPGATDVAYGPEGTIERRRLDGCEGMYVAPEADGSAFLSVVSFDVTDDASFSATTTLGRPGVVYASPDTLYVAARQDFGGTTWFWADPTPKAEATTVHAFRLRGTPAPGSDYAGSGAVQGRVLNAFALDARDGALRVATTTGHLPDPATRSAVSVLGGAGDGLEEVARLDGLAPGEDVRAVRFDGARGFVVTFKKTDPLFVLDLSDPARPSVAGEVQVPGFSTYLHLMDPDHLLTIGFDAEDFGAYALYAGVRLQIFDVANASVPSLSYAEVIGTRGTGSEAAADHLAFNYFPPRDLLGVPIAICDVSGAGWSGLLVYRVTAAGGFSRLGGVASPPAPDELGAGCFSWWGRSTSYVKRSVFLDDFVLAITARDVRVQDTRALGADLARVDLTAP